MTYKSFHDFMATVKNKNPDLHSPQDDRVSVKIGLLEKLLEQAFNAGYICAENEKSLFYKIFG